VELGITVVFSISNSTNLETGPASFEIVPPFTGNSIGFTSNVTFTGEFQPLSQIMQSWRLLGTEAGDAINSVILSHKNWHRLGADTPTWRLGHRPFSRYTSDVGASRRLKASIAPIPVPFRHSNNQSLDLLGGTRPTG
jgi:hypothetical protein